MVAAPEVYQSRARRTEATIAERAREVFAGHRSWRFCHRKADNHPFFMLEGSPARQPDGSLAVPTYMVDLHDCTCPSHRDGRVACKHMRAVRLWFQAVRRGEIAVPRRMTARDHQSMARDQAVSAELDQAESADALLDAYHAETAARRERALSGPEVEWWLRSDGGIVWLQEGDHVGPDH